MIRRLVPAPDPGRPPRAEPGPATPADAAVLAELDRACFGDAAWSDRLWAEECRRLGRDRTILLVRGGLDRTTLAGAVVLSVPPEPDPVDLTRLAVAAAARRRGLGGRLVAAAIASVPGRTMLLEVGEGNDEARRLYARHGFSQIARRPHYYADEAALVMRLEPSPRAEDDT